MEVFCLRGQWLKRTHLLGPSKNAEATDVNAMKHVVGLVGSYRKNGFIDSTVDEMLSAARDRGAKTEKIFLLDQHIEFCTNCRSCMQEPGPDRGKCIHEDDMEKILKKIAGSDSIVIGAPVNCWDVNALTRKFFERCVGYAYWPWGTKIPKLRKKKSKKIKHKARLLGEKLAT